MKTPMKRVAAHNRPRPISTLSRSRFLAASAAGFASIGIQGAPARAAEFSFKCASPFPVEHPSSVRMKQMWAAIEKESSGRIHTEFFPNGVLGGDAAMIPQLRLGAIQFFLAPLSSMTAIFPLANIFLLGFVYKDNQEGLGVVDGSLGDLVRAEITTQDLHAAHVVWAAGMIDVSSSLRPIRTPDDLKSFKVRVNPAKTVVDLFKELGATPTPISNSEIYTALQTKLVDGCASSLAAIETGRLFETQKYISQTHHQCGSFWLLANGAAWKSLPSDLQAIVERNNTKYALLDRRDTDVIDSALKDKLSRQGIAFNEVNQEPFRARLGAYYRSWANEFGPTAWSLLEKSLKRKIT